MKMHLKIIILILLYNSLIKGLDNPYSIIYIYIMTKYKDNLLVTFKSEYIINQFKFTL